MRLTDTHTHLYLDEFAIDGGGSAAVDRAISAGVDRLILPNNDLTTIEPMRALAALYPDNIRMAMGLHPTEVRQTWSEDTDTVLAELGDGTGYIAVGEVGIDLYWDRTFEQQQMLSLRRQVARAVELDLPVLIHCREGLDQTLEVLSEFPAARAVMHCFSGTHDDVERIRRVGDYYFGIGGVVTFKSCRLRDVLPQITLDRILLETDSPYLAPVPHRGKRNESAYVVDVARHIATSMGVDIETVAERTNSNADTLLGQF